MCCQLLSKVVEAVITKMTEWSFGKLIGYFMQSSMQNSCAVLITKHVINSQRVSAFCYISIAYHSIDLSSSTIDKFAHIGELEAGTKRVFKIKRIHWLCFVPYLSVNVLCKCDGKPSILHTLLIYFKRRDSLKKRVWV